MAGYHIGIKNDQANCAKEEITEFNYFQDTIPQDYEYLKRLCEFDFTTEPQKWKNEETKEFTGEYLDWSFALDVLCEICINIFDVLYHIGVASYSPKYTEHYDIYERMILWSEERHKDDDLIEEIVNLSIGKAPSTPEEKNARLEKLWDELEDIPEERIIKDLIADNEENNIEPIVSNEYGKGYYEGYHDALVDLMNKLGIQHNETIYNS